MENQSTPGDGFFSKLLPVLADRTVVLILSKSEEGNVSVSVPRQLKDGKNQALTTPLCVTGTASELDAEFVPQISSFVASHVRLSSNLAQIQKEIEEAEKAAREEAKKRQKSVGGAKKAAEGSTPPPTKTEPVPVSPPMLSLFDEGAPAPTTAAPPAQTP